MAVAGCELAGEGGDKILYTNILPGSHKAKSIPQNGARDVRFADDVWRGAVKDTTLKGGIVARQIS